MKTYKIIFNDTLDTFAIVNARTGYCVSSNNEIDDVDGWNHEAVNMQIVSELQRLDVDSCIVKIEDEGDFIFKNNTITKL